MRLGRVAVAGHSMSPTLRDGDWLLYRDGAPRAGDLVVARDPRDAARWLVKRLAAVDDADAVLTSDSPGHATLVAPRERLVGRVVFRYWPLGRIGPL